MRTYRPLRLQKYLVSHSVEFISMRGIGDYGDNRMPPTIWNKRNIIVKKKLCLTLAVGK